MTPAADWINRTEYPFESLFFQVPAGRMLIRRYNFFAGSIMRKAYGDPARLTPAVHAHYLNALASPADRKGCLVFPGQIIGSTPWLGQLRDSLSVLKHTPALIVWGMKDIAFREKELKRWEKIFPRARSVRVPHAGHFVQEEAPDELAEAVILFLDEALNRLDED